MASCHDVKKGTVFTCKTCGLALTVTNTCKRYGTPQQDCDDCEGQYKFSITCCGTDLTHKN